MPQLDIIIGFNIYFLSFFIIFVFLFCLNFFFLPIFSLYNYISLMKTLKNNILNFCFFYFLVLDNFFFYFWKNIYLLNIFLKRYLLILINIYFYYIQQNRLFIFLL